MKTKELIYLFTEELNKIKKKPDETTPFKIRAYVAVLRYLYDNFSINNIITSEMINGTSLTKHMKMKLCKLLDKKILPDSKIAKKILFNEIKNIMGIGNKKAEELIKKGLTSTKQLYLPKWQQILNTDTKITMKVKPMKRIPHQDIVKIEPLLKNLKNTKIILVGSYRRKMPYSKDIDIMLVSNADDIMDKYLLYLQKHIKNIYVYSKGIDKMSIILKFDRSHIYKADIFKTDPNIQYSMLLYSTGSKNFNIRMRGRAKRMGYLLNQNGLFDKNGNRILLPISREEAYFKILGMKYIKPEDRK